MPETTLKHRFLKAIVNGELGKVDDRGIIVTLKEFKAHFKDIQTQYVTSFLPAATIEIGQRSISRTRFVFRLSKGVYLVHPDAIKGYESLEMAKGRGVLMEGASELDV